MSQTDKQTIIDLETKFWQAIVDSDTEAAVSLLTGKSVVTGAQGLGLLSKDDYRRMASEAGDRYVLKSFKFGDVKVTFPAADVAVIAYKVDMDMDVEGEALKLEAADTTTWVKKDNDWLAAAHTEALLGDPFGRDRKAA